MALDAVDSGFPRDELSRPLLSENVPILQCKREVLPAFLNPCHRLPHAYSDNSFYRCSAIAAASAGVRTRTISESSRSSQVTVHPREISNGVRPHR